MTLVIDPRDQGRTRLVLIRDGRLVVTADVAERDGLLTRLAALLAEHGGPGQIELVGVVLAGGSFSGVRQAVTVARTMAFAQGIPVRAFTYRAADPSPAECRSSGKALNRIAYAAAPHITRARHTSRRQG